MSNAIDLATLGRIRRIDAREVWKHEALAFTPWLEQHIDQLNEAIGVEIELTGREERVGPFAVDLFGKEVLTGHPAIIENQLEATDHSHLGQLLTYAAGLKAGVIVWISPKFRDEHREALNWLNEISPEDVNFFGVEIEILDINGQRAPNFKPVAQSNAWQKLHTQKGRPGGGVEPSERAARYQAFFASLLESLKARSPGITSASKAGPYNWFMFGAGRSGTGFAWVFASGNRFRVELYIDTGDPARNSAISVALRQDQSAIEHTIGAQLLWPDVVPESVRSKRIALYAPFSVSIDSSEDDLQRLHEWAVDTMLKFVQAFRPRLKALSDSVLQPSL